MTAAVQHARERRRWLTAFAALAAGVLIATALALLTLQPATPADELRDQLEITTTTTSSSTSAPPAPPPVVVVPGSGAPGQATTSTDTTGAPPESTTVPTTTTTTSTTTTTTSPGRPLCEVAPLVC